MKKILIIDDDSIVRDLVCSVLLSTFKNAVEIEIACNGLDGIQKIDSDVCLILTNLAMPEINGYDVVRRTRSMFPDTKIIMMTGSLIGDIPENVKIDDLLIKPFKLPDLISSVRSCLISNGVMI